MKKLIRIFLLSFCLGFIPTFLFAQPSILTPNPTFLDGRWWMKLSAEEKIIYCAGFIASNNTLLFIVKDLNINLPLLLKKEGLSEQQLIPLQVSQLVLSKITSHLYIHDTILDLVVFIDAFYTNYPHKQATEISILIYDSLINSK